MYILFELLVTGLFLYWAWFSAHNRTYGRSTSKIVLAALLVFGVIMILLFGEESIWTKLVK